MVMAGFDPGRIKAYFPGAGEGHRALRAPLAARGGGRRSDRPAGRPHALHGRRHRRARVRRRHQHHRVGQRRSSSSTSTRSCRRSSSACWRRFRTWRWLKDRSVDKHLNALQSAVAQFIAQARARMEAEPGAAQPADQPDRVDDRRARHRGQRRGRRRRRGQRAHHAARRRGHHRQHAGLDDLPAEPPSRGVAPRARGSRWARTCGKYEDVSALPYVDACINETMRLKPVAPILMLEPIRDTKLGELEVPAGHAAHVPDARRRDRRAALPGCAGLRSRSAGCGRFRKLREARGDAVRRRARACVPGRYLAILEMKMVMAMLLRRLRHRERHHARRRRGAGAPRVHHVAGRACA